MNRPSRTGHKIKMSFQASPGRRGSVGVCNQVLSQPRRRIWQTNLTAVWRKESGILCGAQSPVAWASSSSLCLTLWHNERGREGLVGSYTGKAGFYRSPLSCVLKGREASGRTTLHLPAHASQYYNWRSLCLRKFLKDPENMFFTIYFKAETWRRDPVTIFGYVAELFIRLLITGSILHTGVQLRVCAGGPHRWCIILGIFCMDCF